MIAPRAGYLNELESRTKNKMSHEQGEARLKSPLRPSAAGNCTRALPYKMMEHLKKTIYESEEHKPNVHRLLGLGSHIERHVIEQLELVKPEFEVRLKQHPVSLGVLRSKVSSYGEEIKGSIDLVLWSDKYRCVVDVKSKKDWSTGWGKTNWSDTSLKLKGLKSVTTLAPQSFFVADLEAFLAELAEPFFEANFLQLNMYAHSADLKSLGVDHCAILQYNKNTSEMREVIFLPSQPLFQKVMTKFQIAMDAGLQGNPELAPRDFEKNSIVCRYCRFFKTCKPVAKSAEKTKEQ